MIMTESDIFEWVEFARKQDKEIGEITNPYEICYQFGIDIISRNTDNDGYLICTKGCKFIIISSKIENSHRKRFIAAHELGHYLIHNDDMYCCSNLYDSDIDILNSFNQEQQANEFASELLLPKRKLQDLMWDEPIHFDDISRIADCMDVSMTMCARKAVKLSKTNTELLLFYNNDRLIWQTAGNKEWSKEYIKSQFSNYSLLKAQIGTVYNWRNENSIQKNEQLFIPYEGQKMILIADASRYMK